MKLEICIDQYESAVIAQASGADRIELCAALELGGLTPSMPLLARLKNEIKIPIFVLIRPRIGDFVYSDQEYKLMLDEIALAKANGAAGIVCGVLLPNGQIDLPRTQRLIEASRPLQFTFHRAIDLCTNIMEATESLLPLKPDYILSSGGDKNAFAGGKTLKKMVEMAKGQCKIMAGGGLTTHNYRSIVVMSGVQDLHCSLRKTIPGLSTFDHKNVAFNANFTQENTYKLADSDKIKEIAYYCKNQI